MPTYRMKGQEYLLPDEAKQIQNEDEAGRIRWLATYSNSEPLRELARELVRVYDAREVQTPAGVLSLPGLTFELPLKREAYVNLQQANSVRDEVLASLSALFASLPADRQGRVYAALQTVLINKVDATWWCQNSTKEAIQDLSALVSMAMRK